MDCAADSHAKAAAANRGALDWLNFLLADVKDGLGPFLAIFLTSSLHWDAGQAGIVLSVGGIATVLARGPAGALVDSVEWKRTLIAISAVAVAVASITIAAIRSSGRWRYPKPSTASRTPFFPLAITAISLGIVGSKTFTGRIGRNEAWNHAGNVATAIAAGIAGYLIAPSAVLWIVAAFAILSVIAVYRVDAKAIDHGVARGEHEGKHEAPESIRLLLANRPLSLVYGGHYAVSFCKCCHAAPCGREARAGTSASEHFIHGVLYRHRANSSWFRWRSLSAERRITGAGSLCS